MRHYTRVEMAQVYDHVLGERLPGMGVQGIHEVSTTQRYEVGARRQISNRVYHYALTGVGATGLDANFGAKSRNQQDIGFSGLPAAGAVPAGSVSITITVGAGDGPAQDGSFPVNYLRGGTIILRSATSNMVRGITGNPLKAAGAGVLLITLDAPTSFVTVLGNQQEALASPYANVVHEDDTIANQLWQPVIGMPTIDTVAGDYVWLQTWGPCVCIGAVAVGGAANNLLAYAGGDAALAVFANDGGIQ